MTTFVILHGMITKDERSLNLEFFFDNVVTRGENGADTDG
jgi:hypothetical protein